MVDADLAAMYGVETKQLKRQVKRNIERFPDDFIFELTLEEYESLRCQNGTIESGRGQHSSIFLLSLLSRESPSCRVS